jgi:hypothetical protein
VGAASRITHSVRGNRNRDVIDHDKGRSLVSVRSRSCHIQRRRTTVKKLLPFKENQTTPDEAPAQTHSEGCDPSHPRLYIKYTRIFINTAPQTLGSTRSRIIPSCNRHHAIISTHGLSTIVNDPSILRCCWPVLFQHHLVASGELAVRHSQAFPGHDETKVENP